MFDPSLLGRLSFTPAELTKDPLPSGRNRLGVADERDSVLFVPTGLDALGPVPLFVMFHGAGGFPEKVLPFIEEHAEREKFLILAPHSMYPTWDIVIGGSGPDLERLHRSLIEVTSRYRVDRDHLAFAGFSDGAGSPSCRSFDHRRRACRRRSLAFSGGFMSIFSQEGAPKVFRQHGARQRQRLSRPAAAQNWRQLNRAGYDVRLINSAVCMRSSRSLSAWPSKSSSNSVRVVIG